MVQDVSLNLNETHQIHQLEQWLLASGFSCPHLFVEARRLRRPGTAKVSHVAGGSSNFKIYAMIYQFEFNTTSQLVMGYDF